MKLKVWGGMRWPLMQPSKSLRTIVAAENEPRAAELLSENYFYSRSRWQRTSDAAELAIATEPGAWVNHGTSDKPEFERIA